MDGWTGNQGGGRARCSAAGLEQAGASSCGVVASWWEGETKEEGRLEEWNKSKHMQEVCACEVEEGPAIGLIHDLYTARHQCTSDGSAEQQKVQCTVGALVHDILIMLGLAKASCWRR